MRDAPPPKGTPSNETPPEGVPLLEVLGITRRFGHVIANNDVGFAVQPGEIHALLGENGAGKSTLVKILSGLLAPDAGEIRWHGKAVEIRSPAEARRLGIGMVHQHFALFEGLSVAENIALGLPGAVPGRGLERRVREVASTYGLHLDPKQPVFALSAGEKQRIEIVRVLLQDPSVLILDEPTSVLTPQESDQLFDTLRRLAADGRGIVFISHKLREVVDLCQRATILRGGKVVAECDPRSMTKEAIGELMLGSRPLPARAPARAIGAPALEVHDLVLTEPGGARLAVPELVVAAGQIIGIAGIAGNGQEALYRALSGERTVLEPETVRIAGQAAGRLGPNARRALGAGFVPEERLGHAAVPAFDLTSNVLLSGTRDTRFQSRGWVLWRELRQQAARIVETFDVRHGGLHQAAQTLSGGNLQKFVVGREMTRPLTLLVTNQPTWGVDMGAAQRIRQAMTRLAAEGTAVVLISQDLDELLELCDQLAVLHAGELSLAQPVASWSIEALGLAMTGADQVVRERIAS